jgi:PKD repeat protein
MKKLKKIMILCVGAFFLMNLILVGFLGNSTIQPACALPDILIPEKTTDDYEPENVFYLCSPSVNSNLFYLSGVPLISDGSDPDINLRLLKNGGPEYAPWPREKKATLVYNQSFNGEPYIQLILNSFRRPDKVINVELGLDTDNDDNFEVVCTFPPYHTTGSDLDGTMEEEPYEAYGTWQGGKPPAVVNGWLKLRIVMTSPNGEDCLLYCGFDYKLSWLAVPYMHTDLVPRAGIKPSSQNQGFETNITVGDRIWFDGSASYDPNDDLNGNERIDPGEVDRLRYRWRFGDGTSTTLDYPNKNVSHIYTSNSIPKYLPFSIFEVNLTVMDNEGHTDWARTYVKIYRGNHSPEIKSFRVNNIENCIRGVPEIVKSPLDQLIKVHFQVVATDKDGDDLTYHWDFNNDGWYDIEGDETEASSVYYTFSKPNFEVGHQKIKLTVSDGTLVKNASRTCSIKLVKNQPPVAKIRAKKELDPQIYEESITVRQNQVITFDASQSYDPDRLPGFDTDSDYRPDYHLKYRWNFNAYDSTASSGWVTEQIYEHVYISAGGDYKYIVTLDVDDGLSINTSANFTVNINVRPNARITMDSASYNSQGNFEVGRPIYFNGTGSYDPNGDEILGYSWDFGDGNISEEPNPVHSYSTPSEYSVSLIVSDYEFASIPDRVRVEIPHPPKPPVIKYSISPLEVYTHQQVNYDASETFDLDSDYRDLKFRWSFGDNNTATGAETTHRYLTSGQYRVVLEVTDEAGAMSTKSEIVVHVLNRKPIAKITQIKNVPVDETVRVSGTGSRDDDGYIISYLWNFGDGTETSWTNESTVEHKWKHATTYTITLLVQDNSGLTNETQIQINVIDTSKDSYDEAINTAIIGSIIGIIIFVTILSTLILFRRAQSKI